MRIKHVFSFQNLQMAPPLVYRKSYKIFCWQPRNHSNPVEVCCAVFCITPLKHQFRKTNATFSFLFIFVTNDFFASGVLSRKTNQKPFFSGFWFEIFQRQIFQKNYVNSHWYLRNKYKNIQQ